MLGEGVQRSFVQGIETLTDSGAEIVTGGGLGDGPGFCFHNTLVRVLATHPYIAATSHDDFHRVSAAGPAVSADLPAEQTVAPADGRRLGTTTGDANIHAGRTTATGRIDTQRRLDRRRRAAATGAALGLSRTYRSCPHCRSHEGHGQPRITRHRLLPSVSDSQTSTPPLRQRR